MTTLDTIAAQQWTSYLNEVRSALSMLNPEQIDEIIVDLENHFDDEATSLASSGLQLGETEVAGIISRLGQPAAIAEAYEVERGGTKRIEARSLSLLLVSFLLVAAAIAFPVMLIIFVPGSAIIARIALTQPDVIQSTYRWAAYPGLIAAYTLLMLLALFWILIPVLPLAATGGIIPQLLSERDSSFQPGTITYWIQVWSLAFIVTGIWWVVLHRFLRNQEPILKQLFFPFFSIVSFLSSKALIAGATLQIIIATAFLIVY